ncbi:MAG: amidohydrolase family protein [Lentisphaeria bacterium]|nr:amidohydrolase family protein [Lentisphaeria bacterium]
MAITDAMQGAGLASGRFQDTGEWYTIRAGELARWERDNAIVGSSLTMNRAFRNMVRDFGFTPVEASLATSANPAAILGLADRTGMLRIGYAADITVLGPDLMTVKDCRIARA